MKVGAEGRGCREAYMVKGTQGADVSHHPGIAHPDSPGILI